MVNISRLFFRATGLMPNKEIVRTCKSIGSTLAREYKPGENVDVKRVQKVLREHIGAKKAARIEVADDFATFKRYTSSAGIDEELAKLLFTGSRSAVMPNPNGKQTLLSLRLSGASTSTALNLTAHELEHALHDTISPRAAIANLYLKIRGKKYTEKLFKKYGTIMNEKSFELQQMLLYKGKITREGAFGYTEHSLGKSGLLAQMGLKSENSLKDVLSRLVRGELTRKDKKLDIKILKVLKGMLKDESRAYKSGGAVERYFDEVTGTANPNANQSEMLALLYDETGKTIRKEIRKLRKERIKSFFGLTAKKRQAVETIQNPDGSTTTIVNGKKVTERKLTDEEINANALPDDIRKELTEAEPLS